MMRNRSGPPQSQPQSEPPPSRLNVLRRRLGAVAARFRNVLLVGAGAVVALVAMFLYDASRPPPQHLTQRDIDAAVERTLASATPAPSYQSQAYDIIRPSVVRIVGLVPKAGGTSESALGTGVVIDESGVILTNLHIVKDAVEIRVLFADGTRATAQVIVTQPENDLAVLRADETPDDLVAATLTSSATLRVGDEVMAVGNPFGVANSLTSGVVSGLDRMFKSPKTGETLTGLVQFDAAVNPGNSGGPLVNRNGEVVGIVTALLNPTDQDVFIGIGFAVPIEAAATAAGPPWY